MAFHDDVDDANDANDKTSSEHEFELPFPRPAASSNPAADSADDSDESSRVDLSEASNSGIFDLDAELESSNSADDSPQAVFPPPPSAAPLAGSIDLNDEFQRSEMSDGLDQGKPPWAMAPAPDPTQAVPQLDAPDGFSDEERSALSDREAAETAKPSSDEYAPPKSAAAPSDDPYQIPIDYTTPDFFAARISRRGQATNGSNSDNSAESDSAEEENTSIEDSVNSNTTESADFNFDSLFATDEPAAAQSNDGPDADTSWAEMSSAGDSHASTPTADSPGANNLWKLGPLEPNVADSNDSADEDVDSSPTLGSGTNETPVASDEVIVGAPMWNLDGVDTPAAANLAQSPAFDIETDGSSSDVDSAEPHDSDRADLSAPKSGSELDDAFASLSSAHYAEAAPTELPDDTTESPAEEALEADDTDEGEVGNLEPATSDDSAVIESASTAVPSDGDSQFAPEARSIPEEPETAAAEEALEAAGHIAEAETDADVEDEDEADVEDAPVPPLRRSMADDELLNWADNPENHSTGTLSVIEVLEAQLRLREEEAREYREWETTLRAKPQPARDDGADDEQHAAPAPAAADHESSAAAPDVSETPSAPLPAWDVPPPSDTWAPADDFDDEIPFAAHADPTGSITLPVLGEHNPSDDDRVHVDGASPAESESELDSESESTESADIQPADDDREPEVSPGFDDVLAPEDPDFSEFAAPATYGESVTDPTPEPEPELPFDEEPAAQSEPAPETETIVPHFDAVSGLLSLDDATVELEGDAQSVDANLSTDRDIHPSPDLPADEDGDYDEIPFTPPPLVEPVTAPSTPRSNLDEHVSFGDFGFTPPISGSDDGAAAAGASPERDPHDSTSVSDGETPFAFDLDSPATSDSSNDANGHESSTTSGIDDEAALSSPEVTPADVAQDDSEAAPETFSFASAQTPRYVPTEPINFDDLLKADGVDDRDHAVEVDEPNPLDALIADNEAPHQSDPLSAVATGSISIGEEPGEAESDDAVDASDRLTYAAEIPNPQSALNTDSIPFAAGAIPVSAAVTGAESAAAATENVSPVPAPMPLSTARVSQQPLGLEDVAPTAQPVFSLEESGLEPTPIDRRIGHAARLFWLWFAANSSIVSVGLGAAVFGVGMSLRQSVVAILAGVALSFVPLGLTTLAGKRSGQPTMVISRSAFGLIGNIVPSAVALVARLFWGAVLLWVLASSVAIVLVGSDLNVGLGDRQLLLISLALSFLVALVIAFAGYPLFARIQLILSIISGILVAGLIGFTAQYVDLNQALTTPDGSWLLTLTGAVLVFSFLGLVWAYSGADIARYQRPSSSGPASALSAAFGATLPAFVLIAYGALLAASDPAIARGFLASPLDTLLLLLPGWFPIPLLLAAALSLLSGITLSLYSGGFALQAIGVRLPRQWSIVIVGVLLGALAVLFAFGVNGGINEIFRDVATTLAVPTAAWAGIFAAETMIRTRRLDSAALTKRGGIYPDVRWVNLSAFVVISAVGFALTSATIGWLSWQGYGFTALGVDLGSELAATDLGVLVALVLGLLTPIVAGIPAIRRQEAGHTKRASRPA